MITPTKAIAPDRALLTVAAQILKQLDGPTSVDQAWRRLKGWRRDSGQPSVVSFTWFVLACDVLYSMGALEMRDGLLVPRRPNASET